MDSQQTANNLLRIKFWGVRGSHPAPGPDTVQVGGNTPCVEIQAGGQIILLDAGTGIIAAGRDLIRRSKADGQPVEVTLLFSHMHHDHTQGFPFFAPAFIPTTRLHIFGPHTFEGDLDQVLAGNMIPPVFPVTLHDMHAAMEIAGLTEDQALLLAGRGRPPEIVPAGEVPSLANLDTNTVVVRLLRSYAHPGGVLVYRIEYRGLAVVYATDTEGYAGNDRRLSSFAQGAGMLIHDAQYTEAHYLGQGPGVRSTQGWGHSTARMAIDVAKSAGAPRLALFHHDPSYSDETVAAIEAEARDAFSGAFAAREGLEVYLPVRSNPAPVDQPAATLEQALERGPQLQAGIIQ